MKGKETKNPLRDPVRQENKAAKADRILRWNRDGQLWLHNELAR